MGMFSLEHGKLGYNADFVVYGIAVAGFALALAVAAPRVEWSRCLFLVLLGLAIWSLVEYLLHRFVLHRLLPFRRWHAVHHQRPKARISTPTIFSAALILVLTFLPMLFVAGLWSAVALTLGVLMGYLAYSLTHHAIHHWHGNSMWLKRRKHWHALHHRKLANPGYYAVTSTFWDRMFGSDRDQRSLD